MAEIGNNQHEEEKREESFDYSKINLEIAIPKDIGRTMRPANSNNDNE
jgi:hypothetical protein